MQGKHSPQMSLFDFVDDRIPKDHPLQVTEQVDFSFVGELAAGTYGSTGGPTTLRGFVPPVVFDFLDDWSHRWCEARVRATLAYPGFVVGKYASENFWPRSAVSAQGTTWRGKR